MGTGCLDLLSQRVEMGKTTNIGSDEEVPIAHLHKLYEINKLQVRNRVRRYAQRRPSADKARYQ